MEGAAADVVQWLEGLPPSGIYAVLFAVAYGENIVPPIWGDTVIVLCGSFVGLGVLSFAPTLALAALGGALGFMTVYGVGLKLGSAIHDPTRLRWIPRGPMATVEVWLRRYGYGVVAANRFLSGGRSVIGLLVGASDLRWAPTALWATVSATVWSALLILGGSLLGAEWERLLDWLAAYGRVVTAVLAVVLVAVGVVRWRRGREKSRRRAPAEASEGPPAVDGGGDPA